MIVQLISNRNVSFASKKNAVGCPVSVIDQAIVSNVRVPWRELSNIQQKKLNEGIIMD